MKKRMVLEKWIVVSLMLITIAFGTAGCGNKTKKAEAQVAVPGGYELLSVRYQGSADRVLIHELAEDLGYLEPVKLNYLGNVNGGPQDLQDLATNQTDIAGAFFTAVINVKAAGADIRAVVGNPSSDEKSHNDFFVLEDSPIRSARDLIGKTVGVNTFGAQYEATIKEYLFRAGLTKEEISQVELVVIPYSTSEQPLRSKQIDGVLMGDVVKEKALAGGGIRSLFSDEDLLGLEVLGVYSVRQEFIDKYPNTTRKLVEGIAKAYEWSKATPRDEVVARLKSIINKRGRFEDDSVVGYWQSYGMPSEGGLITDKAVQTWIDWLVRQGDLQQGRFKASDIYTNEFNPYFKR